MDARNDSRVKRLFSSPTESLVCILGNNLAESFLANGILSNGFAILSDKRVYFKGKCYSRTGKNFTKTTEERIVDVKDVTGTGFIHYKPLGRLIFGFILIASALMSIPAATEGESFSDFAGMYLASALLVGIIMVVSYFINRRSLFEISFAGGAIAFNTVFLNSEETQVFQRNIRLVKDAQAEQYEKQSEHLTQQSQTVQPSSNIAEDLKKYKELLDSGIISENEYTEIKNRLIASI